MLLALKWVLEWILKNACLIISALKGFQVFRAHKCLICWRSDAYVGCIVLGKHTGWRSSDLIVRWTESRLLQETPSRSERSSISDTKKNKTSQCAVSICSWYVKKSKKERHFSQIERSHMYNESTFTFSLKQMCFDTAYFYALHCPHLLKDNICILANSDQCTPAVL